MRTLAERYQGLNIYRVADAVPGGAPLYEVVLQMKPEQGTLAELRRKIAAVSASIPRPRRSRWQDAKLK